MSILAGLIGLLGLLFILVAVLGVVAPRIFKDKKTGEVPKRSHMLAGGAIAAVIAFVIAGVIAPAPEETPTAEPQQAVAKSAPQSPAPAAKSLGMTPEEFRREFNRIINGVNKDYKLAEFDIEKGEVNDTFTRALAGNVSLLGSVNKNDGSLKELMVMVGGGQEADVLKPVAVLLTASHAANPTVAKEENSKVVMAMLKQALANVEDGKAVERTVGKLNYTASASKLTGLMFVLSPI